jgi:hypothetical protein
MRPRENQQRVSPPPFVPFPGYRPENVHRLRETCET